MTKLDNSAVNTKTFQLLRTAAYEMIAVLVFNLLFNGILIPEVYVFN